MRQLPWQRCNGVNKGHNCEARQHINRKKFWWISHTLIDEPTARRCTAIVTSERAWLSASDQPVKNLGRRPCQRRYNCDVTAHPHTLWHRHYYFNQEVSYWLQFSITGSKFCGFIANLKTWNLHVKRYEIDSLIEVYYLSTSCYGNGHVLDPSIITTQCRSLRRHHLDGGRRKRLVTQCCINKTWPPSSHDRKWSLTYLWVLRMRKKPNSLSACILMASLAEARSL